jgi:hypothetical protein
VTLLSLTRLLLPSVKPLLSKDVSVLDTLLLWFVEFDSNTSFAPLTMSNISWSPVVDLACIYTQSGDIDELDIVKALVEPLPV